MDITLFTFRRANGPTDRGVKVVTRLDGVLIDSLRWPRGGQAPGQPSVCCSYGRATVLNVKQQQREEEAALYIFRKVLREERQNLAKDLKTTTTRATAAAFRWNNKRRVAVLCIPCSHMGQVGCNERKKGQVELNVRRRQGIIRMSRD